MRGMLRCSKQAEEPAIVPNAHLCETESHSDHHFAPAADFNFPLAQTQAGRKVVLRYQFGAGEAGPIQVCGAVAAAELQTG